MIPFENPSSAGPAGGGFKPDPYSQYTLNAQRQRSQELMEWAHRNNARVHAMHNKAATTLLGNGAVAYDWMHYSRAGQFALDGAAMLQNTGLFGSGSFVDLMYGTQQGIASMGGHFKTGTGGFTNFGGGQTTDVMSRMLYSRMNQHFFAGGMGASNINLGMDPTQVGRSFNYLSQSGAFAGMQIGAFGEKSLEERIRSGVGNLKAHGRTLEARQLQGVLESSNPSQALSELSTHAGRHNLDVLSKEIEQIQTTSHGFKDADTDRFAKTMMDKIRDLKKINDSLDDVFGEMTEMQAGAMATRLTGITNAGDLKKSGAIIEGLKTQALALGMDQSEFLNMTAMSADVYTAAGMGMRGGSVFANLTASSVVRQTREHTAAAGIRTRGGRGAANYTSEDIVEQNAKDFAGMSLEVENRTALEMMFNASHDSRLANNSEYMGLITTLMTGSESEATTALGRAMQMHKEMGIGANHLSDADLANSLTDKDSTRWAQLAESNIQRRTKSRTLDQLGRRTMAHSQSASVLTTDTGKDFVHGLYQVMDANTRSEYLTLLKEGKVAEAEALLEGIDPFLQKGGSSAAKFSQNTRDVMAGMGDNFAANMEVFETFVNREGSLANLDNVQNRLKADTAISSVALSKSSAGLDGRRDQVKLREKIFRAVMNGEIADISVDDVFQFGDASGVVPKIKFGVSGDNLTADSETLATLSGNAAFMSAMNMTSLDQLKAFMDSNDPTKAASIVTAMSTAGITSRRVGDSIHGMTEEELFKSMDIIRESLAGEFSDLSSVNLSKSARSDADAESRANYSVEVQKGLHNRFADKKSAQTSVMDALTRAMGEDGDLSDLIIYNEANRGGAFNSRGSREGRNRAIEQFGKTQASYLKGELGSDFKEGAHFENVRKLIDKLLEREQKREESTGTGSHSNVTYTNATFIDATIRSRDT